MELTQEHLDAARDAGACLDRLERYSPGDDLSAASWSDLVWIEDNVPALAASLDTGAVPLWAVGGYGYGYGYGDGYGYGSGYGDGYGDGLGPPQTGITRKI